MLGMRRGRARWIALVVGVGVGVAGASLVSVMRADNEAPRQDLGEVPPRAAERDPSVYQSGSDDAAVLASPLRVLPTLASDQRWWYINSPQSFGARDGRITSFRDASQPDVAVSVVIAAEEHGVWRDLRRAGAKDPVDVGGATGYRWAHEGRTVIAWRPAAGTVAAVVGRGVNARDLLSTARSLSIDDGRASIIVKPTDLTAVASHTVGVQGVYHSRLVLDFALPTLYEARVTYSSTAPYWTVSGAARDDGWLKIAEALDGHVRHLDIAGREAILIPDEDKLVVLLDASQVLVLYAPSTSYGPAKPPDLLIELAKSLRDYDAGAWRELATSLLELEPTADVVISEQRTATSHFRLSLEGHDPVSDFGRLCTQERTITSYGNEPRCYAVAVGTSRDRCDYESGWTIGFGSPYTEGEDLLYGTVRSDVTAGSVVLDDGERIPLKLAKVPGGSAFQIFSAPIPSGRKLVSAVAMAPGGTLRASWVERPWANNLRSWFEDPTAGLGIAQHIYSGNCPG